MEIDPACDTPNLVEPGKQWSQPMAPMQVYRDGKFYLSVSTPGSYGILQTTLQMLLNIIEFGANIQEAIEAPRFRCWGGTTLTMENRITPQIRDTLAGFGHDIDVLPAWSVSVGGGQGVMVEPNGEARLGGADPRRDGYAVAW
jgi:gamma-glutamyltranspeptidase/glutathione hydrolase